MLIIVIKLNRVSVCQVIGLKEYVRGAFQALSWVRLRLSNVKDMDGLNKVLVEIDEAMDTVKQSIGVDFRKDMETEIKGGDPQCTTTCAAPSKP